MTRNELQAALLLRDPLLSPDEAGRDVEAFYETVTGGDPSGVTARPRDRRPIGHVSNGRPAGGRPARAAEQSYDA